MASSSAEPAASGGSRLLRVWIGVCAVVGVLLFGSQLAEIPARSALRGYDNTFNYLWLRSAMVDGDWDFRNDLAECNTLTPAYRTAALALPVTAAGRIPNKYGLGWAVLTAPFYAIADAFVGAGRTLGLWSLARDGWNPVYQVCIQAGHATLTLAALWMAVQVIIGWLSKAQTSLSSRTGPPAEVAPADVARGVSSGMSDAVAARTAAIAGVVTVWAASPLLYYQTVNLSMTHGAGFFTIAVFAFGLECARRRPDRAWPWILAGAGWGLAVITRFPLGIFGLWAVWACVERIRRKRSVAGAIAGLILGAAPWLALQAWAWRVVYGKWLVFTYGAEGEGFRWAQPALWQSWFSPWHGLAYWHPFLLVGAAGLIAWAWCERGRAAVIAATFGLAAYLSAAWWCWWFASSFGNRSFDAALLPLMAGAAWLFARAPARGRTFLWTAALTLGVWNFYLGTLYRTGAIARHAPVTWTEMFAAGARLPDALRR